jgi:hypothetical protein
LLSTGAHRLLRLLTPERVPLSWSDCGHAAVQELERAGLVVLEGGGSATTIRLTPQGRQWGNPAFNN